MPAKKVTNDVTPNLRVVILRYYHNFTSVMWFYLYCYLKSFKLDIANLKKQSLPKIRDIKQEVLY